MVLDLDPDNRFAAGSKNWVFVHPGDPSLLVKIIRPDIYGHLPAAFRAARKHHVHNSVVRELREHILLLADDPNPPWFLQKIVGFAQTNLGSGLVVKAERQRDGRYAETLSALAQTGRVSEAMCGQLRRFHAALVESPVIAGDIRLSNIVYAYSPDEGDHFVLIDGIGDRTYIPVQRLSGVLNRFIKRRRIARHWKKLARYGWRG